ncbi:glycosyltransferase family 61 protein [Aeoliella sp. ICT_H6.2]|uniref:Glycosyltransferase family 61 protein n=1 Tax=Aeoliella straminimaris TaxID=2954799 RepID=A0A9X2JGT9_9BACT|nr:glycosyltransferase family 61 protein [Aeoliella straminimaris]MCO6045355.1 glycosyltransferase family 61 protein [Aeoliella straminimaris]
MLLAAASHQFPAITVPGGPVVGQPTRLLDAWTPSPLVMWAPEFHYASHSIRFEVHDGQSSAPRPTGIKSRLSDIASRRKEAIRFQDSQLVFDVRYDDNSNVAHILQNQIGVGLIALEALQDVISTRDLVFIVNQGTPQYALDLFRTMQCEAISSDAPVEGNLLSSNPRKLLLRAVAGRWLHRRAVELGIVSDSRVTGDRVFLARRGRRSLTNHEKISQLLQEHDFRTVLLEELSIPEQIQCVVGAETIFGMHGAALGYLLLRGEEISDKGLLLESFPCGYATNWCRAMCGLNGLKWIGLMGSFADQASDALAPSRQPRLMESADYELDAGTISRILAPPTLNALGDNPWMKLGSNFAVHLPADAYSQLQNQRFLIDNEGST